MPERYRDRPGCFGFGASTLLLRLRPVLCESPARTDPREGPTHRDRGPDCRHIWYDDGLFDDSVGSSADLYSHNAFAGESVDA
jgi:hypothetical protein